MSYFINQVMDRCPNFPFTIPTKAATIDYLHRNDSIDYFFG